MHKITNNNNNMLNFLQEKIKIYREILRIESNKRLYRIKSLITELTI